MYYVMYMCTFETGSFLNKAGLKLYVAENEFDLILVLGCMHHTRIYSVMGFKAQGLLNLEE